MNELITQLRITSKREGIVEIQVLVCHSYTIEELNWGIEIHQLFPSLFSGDFLAY